MLGEAPWDTPFIDAVNRALSPGEVLVAYSQCYDEIWRDQMNSSGTRVDQIFSGLDWMNIALTNANLRLVRFAKQRVRTGLLSSRMELIPEVASVQAVPITHIVSLSMRQYQPSKQPNRALARLFRCDVGPVTELGLVTAAGAMTMTSPYDTFHSLATSLQGAITGGALAQRSTSMADAVTRLADLHREGLLSDDEFEKAKSGLVGRSVEVVETSAGLIRQLAQLKDAGLLSDAEFRIKKWDILSRPG